MTTKQLVHKIELEYFGEMEIHFTASHRIGEADTHPDAPRLTTDEFIVESIDFIGWVLGGQHYLAGTSYLNKKLIPILEDLLHEDPMMFFDPE